MADFRFQHRRTTTATADPNEVLLKGEWGIEFDDATGAFVGAKMGDGVTVWSALPYLEAGPGGGAVDSVDGRTGVVTLGDLYDSLGSAAAVQTALLNGAPAGGDTLAELDARIAVVEALGSLATDAELIAAVADLIGSADTAGDTLGELQSLIGLRLLKSANLSDLANAATARTNLGLGNVDDTADTAKPVSTAQQAALDLKAPLSQTINDQTGTTYTFVLGDDGSWCRFANAGPITATVPPNSSVAYPIGARLEGVQAGAGALTLAAGAGVTINFPASLSLVLQEQGSAFSLVQVATDDWDAAGDLTAA